MSTVANAHTMKGHLKHCKAVAIQHHVQKTAFARYDARRSRAVCRSNSHGDGCSQQPCTSLQRRNMLIGVTASTALQLAQLQAPAIAKQAAGDWTSPGLAAPEDPNTPRFFKTESGIKIQELAAGSGPAPENGDLVLIDYVLRRPNGYFIYSTVEGVSFQPRDIPVGPVAFKLGQDARWIQGLQEVVSGMKQGGKLRALIPPNLGYQDCNTDQPQPPTFATKRQLVNHCREPLLFEIALLRVTKQAK